MEWDQMRVGRRGKQEGGASRDSFVSLPGNGMMLRISASGNHPEQ